MMAREAVPTLGEVSSTEHRPSSRARRPLVLPCRGGSAASRLAVATAEALAPLRAGDVLADAEQARRRRGPVVALDGCGTGCATAQLRAAGVEPAASVTLDELAAATPAAAGDPAALAAGFAKVAAAAPRRRSPRRPPVPAPRTPGRRGHTVDDYLLAIDALTSPVVECGALVEGAPTLAAHVSQLLGVSRPTAGEALERLERLGLVRRTAQRELLLSAAGRAAADAALATHRVLELFVTDLLDYPAEEAFVRARGLAEAFDAAAIARLREALGRPVRCPHGWPIDAAAEREERAALTTLAALDAGTTAVVVRLAERDETALRELERAGLTLGSSVRVLERPAHADALVVACAGLEHVLAHRVAAAVLVRSPDGA